MLVKHLLWKNFDSDDLVSWTCSFWVEVSIGVIGPRNLQLGSSLMMDEDNG